MSNNFSNLRKVKSKFNNDEYYLVKDSPIKEIDGKQFVQVKKKITDKNYFLMNKENLEIIK